MLLILWLWKHGVQTDDIIQPGGGVKALKTEGMENRWLYETWVRRTSGCHWSCTWRHSRKERKHPPPRPPPLLCLSDPQQVWTLGFNPKSLPLSLPDSSCFWACIFIRVWVVCASVCAAPLIIVFSLARQDLSSSWWPCEPTQGEGGWGGWGGSSMMCTLKCSETKQRW